MFKRVLAIALLACVPFLRAEDAAATGAQPRQKVIIDTDIGDDIDDAFALALALQSREIHLLGITTATGDTKTRAQLALREIPS